MQLWYNMLGIYKQLVLTSYKTRLYNPKFILVNEVLSPCPPIHNLHSQRSAVSQSLRTDHAPTFCRPYLRFSPLHTHIYYLQNLCCPHNITAIQEKYISLAQKQDIVQEAASRCSRRGGRSQRLLAEVGKTAVQF